MIRQIRRWQKQCITLSWSPRKLLSKKLNTSLSVVMNLEMLLGGGTVDNLTVLILMSLMEYGGLTIEHLVSKLTCFASDKVAVFTSIQTNVVTQLKYKVEHHL